MSSLFMSLPSSLTSPHGLRVVHTQQDVEAPGLVHNGQDSRINNANFARISNFLNSNSDKHLRFYIFFLSLPIATFPNSHHVFYNLHSDIKTENIVTVPFNKLVVGVTNK